MASWPRISGKSWKNGRSRSRRPEIGWRVGTEAKAKRAELWSNVVVATVSQPSWCILSPMGTRPDHGRTRATIANERRAALLDVWLELLQKIEGPRRRRAAEFRRRHLNPIRRAPSKSSQLRSLGPIR
jgi:hypothetical protein